jgi:hypothetical protein
VTSGAFSRLQTAIPRSQEGRIRSRSNPLRRCVLWPLIAALTCCFVGARAEADDGYQLGHGLDLGPLNIAGYSSVSVNLPSQGQKSLALDDLSLFVTGHFNWLLNPFTEAELSSLDILRSGHLVGDRGDGDFVLERVYNDSYLTDSITLRLGKMLTPVGEWNVIHAPPLVLTTVRPAVTYRNFSEYATGASVLYSDPNTSFPELQIYAQPVGELSERPASLTVHQYKQVEGAHVSFPLGLLDKIGVSFQQSKDVHGVDESLYGFDYHYTIDKLTLQGEATYSDISNNGTGLVRDTEWGGYAAASYSLSDQWSAYGWYETFADRSAPSTAHDVLFGIAYRPHPAIVFKLEYLQNISGHPVNPTGVFASWSVLF